MDLKKFWDENKALILAVLYLISPLDIVPEALLGPFGLLDDTLMAVVVVAIIGYRIFKRVFAKKQSDLQEQISGREQTKKIGNVQVVESRDL
jgi:uncharacterized membrane protein YkvA (DUF1232 family)